MGKPDANTAKKQELDERYAFHPMGEYPIFLRVLCVSALKAVQLPFMG
jgi:hypothetical protein